MAGHTWIESILSCQQPVGAMADGRRRTGRLVTPWPTSPLPHPRPSRVTSMTGQTLPVDCRNLPANVYVQLGSSSRHHGWVKECKVGGWGWGRGELFFSLERKPPLSGPSEPQPLDFIPLPLSRGHPNILVAVGMSSVWVEVFPHSLQA